MLAVKVSSFPLLGAVKKLLQEVARERGFKVHEITIQFPIESEDQVRRESKRGEKEEEKEEGEEEEEGGRGMSEL